jgi:Protein of unknown function (DUF1579)
MMMMPEAQKEHRWLQQLVGEWTFEATPCATPGQPATKQQGTQAIRSIGDLWVQGEGQGEMPGGGAATMIITLGFNPQKQRFVGTWVGSMMTHLWVYDGALDPAGMVLTLNAEGPSMSGNGMAKYQDIIELKSDDHHTLTARMLGDDGTWTQVMAADYRRKR